MISDKFPAVRAASPQEADANGALFDPDDPTAGWPTVRRGIDFGATPPADVVAGYARAAAALTAEHIEAATWGALPDQTLDTLGRAVTREQGVRSALRVIEVSTEQRRADLRADLADPAWCAENPRTAGRRREAFRRYDLQDDPRPADT